MSVSKKILVLSSLLALGAGMSASAAPRINGIGQVSWVSVGELGNAGDLIGRSRVVRNAVDVELGGISTGGQKAQGGWSHQHLLEKLH